LNDRLRVAYQGERGSYSEEAVHSFFRRGRLVTVPRPTFQSAFEAIERESADAAVVPVENSYAGSINETHDLLREHRVHVCGEVIVAVSHCLAALPGQRLEDIEVVHSHPQALAQCRRFLDELGVDVVPVQDTAGGARMIREESLCGRAAIASRRAAELYGLDVLATGIQTGRENHTKFYVVTAPGRERSVVAARRDHEWGPLKTALVMATPDRPGALYRCLGALAEAGINLTKLESRPRRDRPWEYLFFVDCEGSPEQPEFARAVRELERRASYLKILGSFPAATDRKRDEGR